MLCSSTNDSAHDIKVVWQNCLNGLRQEIDSQIFSAYLQVLCIENFDVETLVATISAPSRLVCRHVEEHFGTKIFNKLKEALGISNIEVKFIVADKQPVGGIAQNAVSSSPSPYVVVKKVSAVSVNRPTSNQSLVNLPFGQKPNPKYTFSNFIVGNSNEFCHAAAMRVAENPGASYNPLFIYGGVGLGKTHLMHAIGNSVLQSRPDARVMYLSSETFTNALIQSLRQAKMDEFKNILRNIEVLLIDDIQFMRGKETTQEEFFHTFNALYSSKHQIVMTSDKNPVEIPGIEERLRTRFAWGLTADLQAPDFETRVAILNEKARIEQFLLPENVAHFIAENFASNVRELEGALTRLHAVSSLQKIPITIELANSALKSLLQPKMVNLSVDDIKKAVASHFNIKISDMISKRRNKNLAFPRHVAMYLCRKHTAYSYPEIGNVFGGRDHSSVIHAANVISTKMQSNDDIKSKVDEIEKSLLWG